MPDNETDQLDLLVQLQREATQGNFQHAGTLATRSAELGAGHNVFRLVEAHCRRHGLFTGSATDAD